MVYFYKASLIIILAVLVVSCGQISTNEGPNPEAQKSEKDQNNPFGGFAGSLKEVLSSTVVGTDADFTDLFRNLSKYYEQTNYEKMWEDCFSEGFKRNYPKQYFVENISDDWTLNSFSYQSIHSYETSVRINFKAVSETPENLISYADTLYLIKESEWKLENFPFDGSGFFEYAIPPAFYRSIWE